MENSVTEGKKYLIKGKVFTEAIEVDILKVSEHCVKIQMITPISKVSWMTLEDFFDIYKIIECLGEIPQKIKNHSYDSGQIGYNYKREV